MAKYVLAHGGLSLGLENAAAGVPLMPSADPLKPTIVEMEPIEAARINGPAEKQLLPGSRDKGPCLVPLAEFEAANAATVAAAKAKAEVLEKHKAASKHDEKPKGGAK